LATECTIADLHHAFRLGGTTLRDILRQVCQTIWINLKATSLPEPTREQWLEIVERFDRTTNFPNCVGARDGKHIRIVKPKSSGSLYYNYKNYFSFVLIATASSDYKFTFIDVEAYGKCFDSSVFNQSLFCTKLLINELHIPEDKPISNTGNRPIPYVFVADEAFGLTDKIMRPFGENRLDARKRSFNYRLSRARRIIECTFEIFSNKWRILHRPSNVDLNFAIDTVKACCILHNYVRGSDGFGQIQEGSNSITDYLNFQNFGVRPNRNAFAVRDYFADYFLGEGTVPWQNEYV
jgi:hypothetical protein